MERRAITVRGTVQGVGFRPFVHGLAVRYQLGGFVRNESGAVEIEVEGNRRCLKEFLSELQRNPPALAKIAEIAWQHRSVRGEQSFRIDESLENSAERVYVSADSATCRDCLAELFDPLDRRYRYPFINCTNCGPRLTIIRGAPYDRPRTTMADFAMCPQCRREYEDATNRRFHAQPICCPVCGPRLEICDSLGKLIETEDPIGYFADSLKAGNIGALKGLGGYHLVCCAQNPHAVGELRQRKHRDEKPMAIMVRSIASVHEFCELTEDEQKLLESPRCPIVLLRKQPSASDFVCNEVAPSNPYLGVMLPYTPLHHLLLDAIGNVPLVMTSGNRSEEPIAYSDEDAVDRLHDIADLILWHNRPIHVRCDDSVTRVVDGSESPVRRSRGYAPQPITLPRKCDFPLLAVGGQLKGVFALGVDQHATVSHHLGDLDHLDAYRQFERDIGLYEQLFQLTPELIVHDLHPDYASTNYARERAIREKVPTLAVQHHHAHMASCMAENGLDEPVIGVTFDGTGFGLDEATNEAVIWGGEFLVGDYRQFRRAAHIRYVPMPGGDRAVAEPWRLAAAQLRDAERDLSLLTTRIPASKLCTIETMMVRRINSPLTSSAGRLFDAVASIAGVRDYVTYEGQAAVELEWLASDVAPDAVYPFELKTPVESQLPAVIDTRPLIQAVAQDAEHQVDANRIARRFHSTLVAIVTDTCRHIADQTGLDAIVLSGGVFMNVLVTREVNQSLTGAGFRVYRHRLVPPNDGGLSLGQLAVAATCPRHSQPSSPGHATATPSSSAVLAPA